MKAASIDIGSNTIRLLVAEDDGGLIPVVHERAITRLAKGIDSTGRLDPEGASYTIETLKGFMDTALSHNIGPERLLIAATSALREADDSSKFISRVNKCTGAAIRVLTESQEANATALGIMAGFPETCDAFLLDIGGGSTEAITVLGGGVRSWHSEMVGVLKLIDRHIPSDVSNPPGPPGKAALDALATECNFVAGEIFKTLGAEAAKIDVEFIATAGTATTAASVDLSLLKYDREIVNGHVIDRETLNGMFERLSLMSVSERREVIGLEKGREDLIIPGLALTISIMNMFGFSSMKVSDSGLLEGLVLIAMGGVARRWPEMAG